MPKKWNYVKVPNQNNVWETIAKLSDSEAFTLAPWKYCDETKSDEDATFDTIETLFQKLKDNTCKFIR